MSSIISQPVRPNRPFILNTEALTAMGINPETGLPHAFTDAGTGLSGQAIMANVQAQLTNTDLAQFKHRFKWHNLPSGLTSEMMEEILYYKGQGAFFEIDGTFYFLPYALSGSIDIYGRFMEITPLPYRGPAEDEKEQPWIAGLTRKPIYEAIGWDELVPADFESKCVIIRDRTQAYGMITPRATLQQPIINLQAQIPALMRTCLYNGTGIKGLRVNSEAESAAVYAANKAMEKASINNERYIPIANQLEFQELSADQIYKSEEYLEAFQSLDNMRLQFMGIEAGGIYQKKAHMLQTEQQGNAGNIGYIIQDALISRQDACDLINSIWGIGIWCEVSEVMLGMDKTGDGLVMDNQDQSGIPGQQTQEEVAVNADVYE